MQLVRERVKSFAKISAAIIKKNELLAQIEILKKDIADLKANPVLVSR